MHSFRDNIKKDAVQVLGFAVFLAALTFLSYWPSLHYEFVYDDFGYVVQNFRLYKGPTWDNIAWAFTTFSQANWHPLTWLAFLVQYPFFHLNPTGYHAVNLTLHTASAILLFLALRAMTGAAWRSFFVALLFSIHPTRIESVVWIAELKDVLSGFFWMAAMLLYARYAARPGPLRYLAVFFCLALGLMAKPMLVTLPFVFLLLDFWPLGRLRFSAGEGVFASALARDPAAPSKSNLVRLVAEKTPFFLLVAAASVMTFIAQSHGGAVSSLERLPIFNRVVNALAAYVKYLFNLVWPESLAFHYPHPGAYPLWRPLACAAVLAAITWALLRLRKVAPYGLFGWLWYLGTLVPVIGLVQVGTQAMADRYLYIPSIGLFIAVVWGFSDLVGKCPQGRLALRTLGCAAVFVLMMAHIFNLKYWKNEIDLYSRGLEITGPNFPAAHNLAFSYFKIGELDKALEYYDLALKSSPASALAQNNIGLVYSFKDDYDEAEKHFKAAISLNEKMANPYINLAVIAIHRGNFDKAIALAEKATSLDADSPAAFVTLGFAYFHKKEYDKALSNYMKALEIYPDDVNAHYKLGLLYMEKGKLDAALDSFNKVLGIDERYYEALNSIGVIYLKLGRYEEAEVSFKRALEQKKDFKPTLDNLEALKTLRDRK